MSTPENFETAIIDRHQQIAYVRSRGWTRYEPDYMTPGGSWVRPNGKGAQISLACAMEEQRAADAAEPVTLAQALENAVHWATKAGTLALECRRDVTADRLGEMARSLKTMLANLRREGSGRAP